jgi:hypothetical protein
MSGCARKYAESEGSIGLMSSRTGASAPGPETTTGGSFRGLASLGARMFTHIAPATTAQKSVAHMREMRATLLHRAQKRSSSAR